MAARNKPAGSTQAERDRISLGRIEALIDGAVDSKAICPRCQKSFKVKDIPSNVASLMKMRYDKLRPSLSAVEQTNVNEGETLSEEQILLKLQQVIDAHPEVVAKMLQAKQGKPDQPEDCGGNTENAPQQSDNGAIMSNDTSVTH